MEGATEFVFNTTHIARDLGGHIGHSGGENHGMGNHHHSHVEHQELLALFYDKNDIDWIFSNLRGIVTTIWILIASV